MINWTALNFRSRLANIASRTFGGKRDLYRVLGWKRQLEVWDYRARYKRNAVANRIVKALPQAMWHGGAVLYDNDDPDVETPFETAFNDLNDRLQIWKTFQIADTLAGIGRYSIILIGAPGPLDQPLERCGPDNIEYLQAYAEEDATIRQFDVDIESPRFGQPTMYLVKRAAMTSPDAVNQSVVGKPVHWTRVLHIADGLLDDKIYGEPRLECVWNLLDDLEKVHGGGSEAYWKRADPGRIFDVDPTLDVPEPELKKFREEIHDFDNELKRTMLTRGMKATTLSSQVADFKSPIDTLISLISAGTGIPQRVLMGSEQGKLAAKQDSANWDNRVTDRQVAWANPSVIRPFVDRLILLGALPEPAADGYDVRWSSIQKMDDEQRANIAKEWASLNQSTGETVVTGQEIRTRVLGLEPLDEVEDEDQQSTWDRAAKADELSFNERRALIGYKAYSGNPDVDSYQDIPVGLLPKFGLRINDPNVPENAPGGARDPGGIHALPPNPSAPKMKAAAKGGRTHEVADKFRRPVETRRQRLLQRRARLAQQAKPVERDPEPERKADPRLAGYGRDRILAELGA